MLTIAGLWCLTPAALDGAGSTNSEGRYSVKIWPTYFLIDKERIVRQGFVEHPPTDTQIEEMLK